MKYCPNCGKSLEENVTYCENCGKLLRSVNEHKGLSTTSIVLIIVGSVLGVLIIIGLIFGLLLFSAYNKSKSDRYYDYNYNDRYYEDDYFDDFFDYFDRDFDTSDRGQYNDVKAGETFNFDDYEITILDEAKVIKYKENGFNESVVKVPIKIKNLTDDRSISLSLEYSGPRDKDIYSFNTHYEDSIFNMGELKKDEEKEGYIYFSYDKDGIYEIEFDNFYEEIDVKINVAK